MEKKDHDVTKCSSSAQSHSRTPDVSMFSGAATKMPAGYAH